MRDPRQESIKKRCFDSWELPFTAVSGVPVLHAAKAFYSLTGQSSIGPESNYLLNISLSTKIAVASVFIWHLYFSGFLTGADVKLTETDFEHTIKSPYDWRVVVVQASGRESGRGYYLGMYI